MTLPLPSSSPSPRFLPSSSLSPPTFLSFLPSLTLFSYRFDIEGPGLYWSGDQGANAAFFQALVDEAKSLGLSLSLSLSSLPSVFLFLLSSLSSLFSLFSVFSVFSVLSILSLSSVSSFSSLYCYQLMVTCPSRCCYWCIHLCLSMVPLTLLALLFFSHKSLLPSLSPSLPLPLSPSPPLPLSPSLPLSLSPSPPLPLCPLLSRL